MFLLMACPMFEKFASADPNRFHPVRMEVYDWGDITKKSENSFTRTNGKVKFSIFTAAIAQPKYSQQPNIYKHKKKT